MAWRQMCAVSRFKWVCLVSLYLALPAAGREAPSVRQVLRGAQVYGPFTPTVVRVDLRDLAKARPWQPGDPIREILPRRYHASIPHLLPPAHPVASSRDPLLDLQALAVPRTVDPLFGTPILNKDAQTFTGVTPPDPVGDVGPDHYIQLINSSDGTHFVVYSKADGSVLAGPTTLDSLGTGLCHNGFGDPVVVYDRAADRWLLSEFSSGGSTMCVYVSQTSDPIAGGWFAYQFTAPNFPDYPKYAVWPDAYYVSTNESPGSNVITPAVYALDRDKMLAGLPATFQRFTAPPLPMFSFQDLLPGDVDGAAPPPAGAPAYFIRHHDDELLDPGSNDPNEDFLEIWEFHVDFATPGNSTFTGPTSIPVAEFSSEICGIDFVGCYPQPSGLKLDPIREVVMYRLVYRNVGDHEALVGNFATDADGEPDDPNTNNIERGGIRWFELRKTGSDPWSLFQEGTFSPDTTARWMGSIAMDGSGNIALAYSATSPTVFPSLRYVGRLADDPVGSLPQGEYTIVDGSASNSSFRWGDYSDLTVDPTDDCTFYFTGEYSPASAWRTRLASFRFENCSAAPTQTPTATVTGTPPTATPTRTATPTITLTATSTATSTRTRTPTPSRTATRTPTNTRTPVESLTPTETSPPMPTATPTAPTFTPTPEVSPTPTLTPIQPIGTFLQATASAGSPVEASGTLPAGSFRLCVLPNGTYPLGGAVFGGEINCVDFDSPGGPFGPLVVWDSAVIGQYDLLVENASADRTIRAGDRLDAQPGLTVQVRRILGHPGEPLLPLAVLLLAALLPTWVLRKRPATRG